MGGRRLRRRIDEGKPVGDRDESRARAAMDAFTSLEPLAVGDVVVVPNWTPHALQHGVRVAEFQTPSYERYIISFAQKVVTQEGWDSEHAINRMCLDSPAPAVFEPVADGVERIASFDGFGVWRAAVEAARPVVLPQQVPYALCMALDDHIEVGPLRLGPEQACLAPAGALANCPVTAQSGTHCLIAAPGL